MNRRTGIAACSIGLGLALAVLTSCADPCFLSQPDAPNCRAAQGGAEATLTAIRGAQAIEATRSAVMINAASTQAALGVQATAQAFAGQATVQSKLISATLVAADVAATKAAIDASGDLGRSQVKAVGAPILDALLIGTLGAGLVFGVWYSRRGLQAGTRALDLRASALRYGPDGIDLSIVRRLPTGEEQVINLSQLIGPYATTDGKGVREAIGALNLPDQFKAYAWLEANKHQKGLGVAAVTGQWPEMDGPEAEPLAALPAATVNYPYTIATVSGTQQPVSGWLDEVDQYLLAAPQEG
jgi:hypothetical protein